MQNPSLPKDGKVCGTSTAFYGRGEMVYLWRDPRRPRSTGTGAVSFRGSYEDCEAQLADWASRLDVTIIDGEQFRSPMPFTPVEVVAA